MELKGLNHDRLFVGPTTEELEEMKKLEEEARLKKEAEEKAEKERREAEEAAERKKRQEEWVSLHQEQRSLYSLSNGYCSFIS